VCQKGAFLKQPTVSAPLHPSLGYLTPVEFEYQWLAQQSVPIASLLHCYLSDIHLLPEQVGHLNAALQLQLPHDYMHLVPHRKGRGA
jgi:hypothetical protein